MYFILTFIVTHNAIPMALFGWGWKSRKIKNILIFPCVFDWKKRRVEDRKLFYLVKKKK